MCDQCSVPSAMFFRSNWTVSRIARPVETMQWISAVRRAAWFGKLIGTCANQLMVRNTGSPDICSGTAAANVDNRSIIAGAGRRIDETVLAGVKGAGSRNGPSGGHFYNLYNRLEGSGWSCLGRTKVIE
jgi:hypothetical protein